MKEKSKQAMRRWKIIALCFLIGLLLLLAILTLEKWLFSGPSEQQIMQWDHPYGITVYQTFRPQTITNLKQLNIHWIRYQLNWSTIEPQPHIYHWEILDAAVKLANDNHIHMTFPLQAAPSWALRQMCAGRLLFPGPAEMANFGQSVAQRYNGKSGHGYIESYEVGNEEFDSLWTGNWSESIACRIPDYYGPILQATYPTIKAASPQAQVGMNSIWWVNGPHIKDYMQWLYQHHEGKYFDFANFHYYSCTRDPAVGQADSPSFHQEWQTIHAVMQAYEDQAKPIWVTEVGWNTSAIQQDPHCTITPQTQAQYIIKTATDAMRSHVIQHIFWYTVDRGNDGMSLTQPQGQLPAFYALQNFIKQHPSWQP
ncbi:glycosyl hydrolase [Dictyobacter arantiisoli]|uniref:Glycoside hydrolase family 42 N-terminal domain-containing protein n=1 Tax=Dictyobacter arantiisoli TaxID=2014874 RepID=A0A5A5T7J0_9CHLR|nr:glycosyl hydrolase [Dictyobacter arantiisoli]GCF06884.1 hypothetical protein KDI_04480 [Dictyobacter arantiisoli]